MRAELYRIQTNGGALITPWFAVNGTDDFWSTDVQSVFFGWAIKAEFVFSQS